MSPSPGVLDGDHDGLLVRMGVDRDRSVGRRVPECVRHEVEEHALDLVGCAADGRQGLVELDVEVDVPRARLGGEALDAARHEAAERRLPELEREVAGVDPRELEQVVDESGKDTHLVANGR